MTGRHLRSPGCTGPKRAPSRPQNSAGLGNGRFPKLHRVLLGPRPWHIELRHRVKTTSTINLFGFETLKLKIRRLKLWKPTEKGTPWHSEECRFHGSTQKHLCKNTHEICSDPIRGRGGRPRVLIHYVYIYIYIYVCTHIPISYNNNDNNPTHTYITQSYTYLYHSFKAPLGSVTGARCTD